MIYVIVHDGSMLIKNEIKIKAREKIKEIDEATQSKIEEMEKDNDSKLKIIKDRILRDGRKRSESETKQINAQTNVEENRMILDAKGKIIDEMISSAMKELKNLDPMSMKDNLRRILKCGINECRGDVLCIITNKVTSNVFDAKTLDDVSMECGRKIRFEKKIKDMSFGVIIHDVSNNMFLDYSFDSIFKSKEDEIRRGVYKILFE